MKKIILVSFLILAAGALLFSTAVYSWNGMTIRMHIKTAREAYPGNAEEALIAMLRDTARSTYVRTHTAIWTLGQIRSEKAMPLLQELFLDDPDGTTCYGKHDSLLCQYEIHKAIRSIEHQRLFAHGHLRKH
jgi:hypothetical protein